MLDVLLLVPFEPITANFVDPVCRTTYGASLHLPIMKAIAQLEQYVGRSFSFWETESRPISFNFLETENRPIFNGESLAYPKHRSLCAVTLSTAFEKEGIKWKTYDPGVEELKYWHDVLTHEARNAPKAVCLSTTFLMNELWLNWFCQLIREKLPQAKLIVGGYYYATNAEKFLSLDADILFIGEGEVRLPQIVKRLKQNQPLNDIKGLYIKEKDGSLTHTGHVEPLDIATLPLPLWNLAEKIQPEIDLSKDDIEFGVETQRGCVFKCEFCTYRTIIRPDVSAIEKAVQLILNTDLTDKGYINIIDATATFPRDRWEAILKLLIDRQQGSPHKIWAYARVSDITEANAELMARAGVRQLYVGQESGDQRMLHLMKKGTRVNQVRPAIQALGKNGIGATFSFIHGFPGETEESVIATRSLICSLNQDFKNKPVVMAYSLFSYVQQDFASSSQTDIAEGRLNKINRHYVLNKNISFPPKRAIEEVLNTFIAVSKVNHAPFYPFLFGPVATSGIGIFSSPNKYKLFNWSKACERGLSIFLENDLEGQKIKDNELKRIKETILSGYPIAPKNPSISKKIFLAFNVKIADQLQKECRTEEKTQKAGILTRGLLAYRLMKDTKAIKATLKTLWSGNWPTPQVRPAENNQKVLNDNFDYSFDLIQSSVNVSVQTKFKNYREKLSGANTQPEKV